MRQHEDYDLAECEPEGVLLLDDLLRPFNDQSDQYRNGTSFGLNDLEALMSVAFGAKEWITDSPRLRTGSKRFPTVCSGDDSHRRGQVPTVLWSQS